MVRCPHPKDFSLQHQLHPPMPESYREGDDEPPDEAAEDFERDEIRIQKVHDLIRDPEEDGVDDHDRDDGCEEPQRQCDSIEDRADEDVEDRDDAGDDQDARDAASDEDVLGELIRENPDERDRECEAEEQASGEGHGPELG